jgi:uncharacterized protein with GYD domain
MTGSSGGPHLRWLDFDFDLWDDSPPASETKGGSMPHYLHQVAYSREGWASLLANPQNRIEAVRPVIEKLGGKIEAAWFSFGDYDVIVIAELPDNVSAAAIAMAFAGGGACKSVQTTPLISAEEALQALKKAGECGYRPASAQPRAA